MPPVTLDSDTASNRQHTQPSTIPPSSIPPVPAPPAASYVKAARVRTDDGRRTFYAGSSRALPQAGKAIIAALILALALAAWKISSGILGGTDEPIKDPVITAPAHANGQIPTSTLQSIEGSYLLLPDAAAEFIDLRQAFEAAGHTMTVNSAYRDTATQQELVEKYGLLEDGGTAAPVGSSEHGLGIAVDLTLDFEALQWFRANAADFGFTATIAEEPWHWVYTG